MSTNTEEIVVILQLELSEKLDALKAQGLDEADFEAETKKLLLDFGARVQAATMAKAQVSTSSSSSSAPNSGTTTIFAEQAEKFSLKSTKNEERPSDFWRETQSKPRRYKPDEMRRRRN